MLPNTKLTITAASSEGNGVLYVKDYYIPTQDSFEEKVALTGSSSSLSVNNFLSTWKDVFLLIEPSTPSLSFSISTTSQDIHFHEPLGPGAIVGIAVGSSIVVTCMVLLVLIALVIVYKRKKEKQHGEDSVKTPLVK
ncbi:hypothetical protein C9374_003167 [Naegleria lovaniensis]|uniref:Uncharacterized protein n=1 Tax=Naegleria lovaniensis TaxID=51637 RepID=A0AA88KKQ9_NAELO|nr:uncharacterized protein C9374_003167 [Naegleria lovaniensis]KAG2386018.1 hypothetical protein C9374_003167 [Naegleria lovaniensis]